MPNLQKPRRPSQEPRVKNEDRIPLGGRDPKTGKWVFSPAHTLPTAEAFVKQFYCHENLPTLICFAEILMEWRGNRYVEVEDTAMKNRLQEWLHNALQYECNRRTTQQELVGFPSNPTTVRSALESLKALVHIPRTTPCPSWLKESKDQPPVDELIACRSSLLHLPTMQQLPATPHFFSTCGLDFDHDADAPEPMNWHAFLHQLFDGDMESLELLQDWFGYCLTGDTSQQKMLLIVGPRRSGKGTIGRILRELIGTENVCGPTTSSLTGPFGLQPLIGKSLAIVSDARFRGHNTDTVIERLLCISGEDSITVDRKHIASVTLKLPTRFMFLTNELPGMRDASGALAGRFVILRLTESFYGKEDHQLTDRLRAELPGILNWAIEGWHRLRERGHFVMPTSAQEAVEEVADLASPVAAFVNQMCVVDPDERVSIDNLYAAWRAWCKREGRKSPPTRQTFGRDLKAAEPGIQRRRGTGGHPYYEGISLQGGA